MAAQEKENQARAETPEKVSTEEAAGGKITIKQFQRGKQTGWIVPATCHIFGVSVEVLDKKL